MRGADLERLGDVLRAGERIEEPLQLQFGTFVRGLLFAPHFENHFPPETG
jgi:hypothetical protein